MQYLNLGVIDELEIALAPVLFGGGRRLFEHIREPAPTFRIDTALDTPAATHVRHVASECGPSSSCRSRSAARQRGPWDRPEEQMELPVARFECVTTRDA